MLACTPLQSKKEPQVCKDLSAINMHNSNYLELEVSKRYNQIKFLKRKRKKKVSQVMFDVSCCLVLTAATINLATV